MNQIVDEYINSINEIPTFKAALLEKENKKIDEKLENDILNQIFIILLFDKGRNDINLSVTTIRQKGQ